MMVYSILLQLRYGAAELHNIAAILGGIGSQEAVKVLTQQYVPLTNTFVYNGVASVGGSYCL
jgi:NEDD8-activating enzyme E1 regulatory subunit